MATLKEKFGYSSESELLADICADILYYGDVKHKEIALTQNKEHFTTWLISFEGCYWVISKLDNIYRGCECYKEHQRAIDVYYEMIKEI